MSSISVDRRSRVMAPGVAVLLGYVLLVGNPWTNRDIDIALSSSDSAIRLIDVMVFYPSWQVDLERVGAFRFWSSNLRTVLFVGLAIVGLTRMARTHREAGFTTTVGVIALSAVAAGLGAAIIGTSLLDVLPFVSGSRDVTEYFLGQLSASASFGVLFGLVLGGIVAAQRRSPAGMASRGKPAAERRSTAPKSFW